MNNDGFGPITVVHCEIGPGGADATHAGIVAELDIVGQTTCHLGARENNPQDSLVFTDGDGFGPRQVG